MKKSCKGMCCPALVLWILVIIGAINWGLIGVADWNLVSTIFGDGVFTRIIYALVGVAGLMMITGGCRCKTCKDGACGVCTDGSCGSCDARPKQEDASSFASSQSAHMEKEDTASHDDDSHEEVAEDSASEEQ